MYCIDSTISAETKFGLQLCYKSARAMLKYAMEASLSLAESNNSSKDMHRGVSSPGVDRTVNKMGIYVCSIPLNSLDKCRNGWVTE